MSVLGEHLSNFARNHVMQRVGRGECADLITAALRDAGAPTPAHIHHQIIWGISVPLAFVEPGDVLQFTSFRVVIRNVDGRTAREIRGYPAHTAMVLENRGHGVLLIAEQNMTYAGSALSPHTTGTAVLFVTDQVTYDNRTVTVSGRVEAYRPQMSGTPH